MHSHDEHPESSEDDFDDEVEIDMESVVPFEDLDKEDEVDAHFIELFENAEKDMVSKGMVQKIHERYFGLGIPELIAVYLLRMTPIPPETDEWAWFVISKVNSGLFNRELGGQPLEVLDGYLEMIGGLAEHVLNDENAGQVLEESGLPPFDKEQAAGIIELLEEIRHVLEDQMEDEQE
jgi:hypothetical protein